MTRKIAAVAVLAIAAIASPAFAHYLWIEQPASGNAVLRFGEFENALREKSPGRLDDIKNPVVLHYGKSAAPLLATRMGDGFMLAARAEVTQTITATDSTMGVKDWRASGVGIVKPIFYARFVQRSALVAPTMMFDVTPTGKVGQFLITFNGKPLVKSKVDIYAPNGWARDAKSDDAGFINLAMPWRGQYVIEATHKEEQIGKFDDQAFEALRHRAVLTIVQAHGEPTFAPTAPTSPGMAAPPMMTTPKTKY